MSQTAIILNPVSGKKNAQAILKNLVKYPQFSQAPIFTTEYSGHAILLTHQAIKQGARKIIAIGGDGTLHQIVNAVMTQTICSTTDVQIGIISIGTGNDWIRTYGFPKSLDKRINILIEGKTFVQDIGKLTFHDEDGMQKTIYFDNMAGLGFDASVVENTLRKKETLGPLVYIIGALSSLFGFSCIPLQISINGKQVNSPCYLIIAAINRFAGGGMLFAPNAISNDGMFDIVIIKNMSRFEVILNLYNLFKGSYIRHPKVESHKASEFSVIVPDSHQMSVKTQADGELYLHGPYHFSICKKAISFIVP